MRLLKADFLKQALEFRYARTVLLKNVLHQLKASPEKFAEIRETFY